MLPFLGTGTQTPLKIIIFLDRYPHIWLDWHPPKLSRCWNHIHIVRDGWILGKNPNGLWPPPSFYWLSWPSIRSQYPNRSSDSEPKCLVYSQQPQAHYLPFEMISILTHAPFKHHRCYQNQSPMTQKLCYRNWKNSNRVFISHREDRQDRQDRQEI